MVALIQALVHVEQGECYPVLFEVGAASCTSLSHLMLP